MEGYEIGKDMQKFQDELGRMQMLLQQLYSIVEHNIKEKKLTEPKPKE